MHTLSIGSDSPNRRGIIQRGILRINDEMREAHEPTGKRDSVFLVRIRERDKLARRSVCEGVEMNGLNWTTVLLGVGIGLLSVGCEIPVEHGPQPYIQGQPPSTSKNTAYLYGSAEIGEDPQGPGYSTGGDFVDAGSPDAE